MLTYQSVNLRVTHRNLKWFDGRGVDVGDFGTDLSASGLFDEQSRAFQRRDGDVRVNAALEQERRFGVQIVAPSRFADVSGVEAGALDEHRCGAVADARFQSAEHASHTHWLFGVANH